MPGRSMAIRLVNEWGEMPLPYWAVFVSSSAGNGWKYAARLAIKMLAASSLAFVSSETSTKLRINSSAP